MKSNNKIYILFITLALLFWNPISYLLIYGNKPFFSVKVNHIFYWIYLIVFLVGILSMFLIQKNKINEKIKKIIFSVAFAGILFSAFVMIDRLVGLTSKAVHAQKQEGLIFEPNSQARYQTIEFDYVAKINNLGLRDREINVEKGDKFRVLCFGDSFTYGWGVNIEKTYPKILEHFFHDKGFDNVEVINCGQPGQYTSNYKQNMSRIVPLLKPDLVLVGIVQGDDLVQLYQNNFKDNFSAIQKAKYNIHAYLKASFANILSIIGDNASETIKIKSSWKTTANNMINGFNRLQKLRFFTLEDSVQNLFKSGNLQPQLIPYYVDFPDNLIIFNNPNNPATKLSIKEMDKDVKDMKAICQENNCPLIFINLPIHNFTGHKAIMTPNDFLNLYFKNNNKIDSIYNSISTSNGLPYIQLTEYFLSLENKTKYFFLYDGHPNENGYLEIANYIGEQLIEKKLINNK